MRFQGETYDCGDKVGFLAANVAFGLENPDTAPRFREVVAKLMK
jgi:UTP--glucose-1-phosphate uridylyltransferase